jgi:folate-binding protein YgfZ
MTPKYRTIATGLIRFDGPDAASFLHALVTNTVEALSPGQGVYAAWLTPQGRMITDLRLLRDSGQVWAEVSADRAASLATQFDLLIFSEQVQVTDQSSATKVVAIWGDDAAGVVGAAAGVPAATLAALPALGHVTVGDLRVVRTDNVATENFEIWLPESREPDVVAALQSVGADEGSADLLEALRIEAGRPLFGVDMTTDTIPLEAGLLDRAISTTKGCYVGQEVIVRILHRGGGRVVKHLALLEGGPDERQVPAAGTTVFDQGREVGTVSSAAQGPTTGRVTMLASVHRDSAEPGRALTVGDRSVTLVRLTT